MGENVSKSNDNEKIAEGQKKDLCQMDDGPITVVLKFEMHCEGCALKIRQCVKGFKGVEAVASDVSGNKLTVIGRVDPLEFRGRVESKLHKKVELVSPAVPVKKEKKDIPKEAGIEDAGAEKAEKKTDQKADDKKPKEPPVTTVALKLRLHCCDGCTQRVKKIIHKIKGVDSVSIDSEKDLITVKGTMDVKCLLELVAAKMNRRVEIVNQKKDGDNDAKEKGEKKKSSGDGGKKEEVQDAAKKAATEAAPPAAAPPESAAAPAANGGNKINYYGGGYFYHHPYRFEMLHAPQHFSDENPNACALM